MILLTQLDDYSMIQVSLVVQSYFYSEQIVLCLEFWNLGWEEALGLRPPSPPRSVPARLIHTCPTALHLGGVGASGVVPRSPSGTWYHAKQCQTMKRGIDQ